MSKPEDISKDIDSPARRHFFKVITAAAGVTAVTALMASKNAEAAYKWRCDPCCDPVCFLRGTNILTASGNVPVEKLAIGDHVITVSGQERPIKWIGRRSFRQAEFTKLPERIAPVCVAKSALADNVPSRDLYVSPLHAFYIDGVLIPARNLVNGASIRPGMPEGVRDVEYFHIELDSHDVIIAEGAPAETFRLNNGREFFNNFVEYGRMYGADETVEHPPYAPVVDYRGGRDHLKALVRLGISHVIDVRDPIQVAYDRIAARAVTLVL